MKKIAYVGIDYHLKSLTIAVLVECESDFYNVIKILNTDKIVSKHMNKLSKEFEIKACYEASFSGYSFQRKMKSWGYHCDVIAPSLIPQKKGDRRKNDSRDAKKLAKSYAVGDLAIVHVPTEEEESVRHLIRCRLTFKDLVKKTKNQINSLLHTQSIHWPNKNWNDKHLTWLSNLEMSQKHLQVILFYWVKKRLK